MNSSAASRNLLPERRHDYAERLRSTGNVLDSDAESEEIRSYVESTLERLARRSDRLSHDEWANAVFDTVLDVDAHTCVEGRSYCFVCEQQRMGREA